MSNLGFKLNLTSKVKINQSKNNRDLGCFASFVRISDNFSLNGWWIIPPTTLVLTHKDTHTCACNGNTRRPTLSSDRNNCICYNIPMYKVFETESKISACTCHGNNYARISVLMKPPLKKWYIRYSILNYLIFNWFDVVLQKQTFRFNYKVQFVWKLEAVMWIKRMRIICQQSQKCWIKHVQHSEYTSSQYFW